MIITSNIHDHCITNRKRKIQDFFETVTGLSLALLFLPFTAIYMVSVITGNLLRDKREKSERTREIIEIRLQRLREERDERLGALSG